MNGKLRLKGRKKKKFSRVIILILILALICSSLFLVYFDKKISPVLMAYAESETRKLTTLVINKAITRQVASDSLNTDDLFTIVKNDSDEIQLIDFNSVTVTKILTTVTNLVQLNLKAIEEGNIDLLELPDNTLEEYDQELLKEGIICEIPLGTVTGNALLSNIGPKIPLRLNLIGDVVTGVETNVKEYGINNALLEVGINVTLESRINLPFLSDKITVSTTVPIAMKVIQGKIPEIYANGFRVNSGMVTPNGN